MFGPSTITGRHAPHDHLEVRCDATGRLLGWLTGIDAAQVPPQEPLVFEDQSDGLVIEDETGTRTMGIATEIRVDGFEALLPRHNDMAGLDAIRQRVPSYAKRTVLPSGVECRYAWTAAVVTPDEHEELFGFDNFVPYGEVSDLLVVEDLEFHGARGVETVTLKMPIGPAITGSKVAAAPPAVTPSSTAFLKPATSNGSAAITVSRIPSWVEFAKQHQ